MIVLDTHIWVWWVHDTALLTPAQVEVVEAHEENIIGVSAISCWEIAKLVEERRKTPKSEYISLEEYAVKLGIDLDEL